ncbi:class I SAM-dependent methyltransferase [Janthinobacterium psychrotolerans]|uniref:Methyltransferase domain-containing protein n=1 Tax=Janthinobacterium psychrotolerans TaxID=1747903 RepID=A0A1A7BXL4_9BURK|nr:class I SAM-dependent methyltransferase [Janthinobacterium psychrotolerans]OBV38346.1 Methyltransferase domain-containing protein [Janthinobacterium psychrotolerans]
MSTPTTSAPPPAGNEGAPDMAAIRQRQQATWASGDFAIIGVTLQIVGESLAEAADIRAREEVIDIAAGNGNASLAAARRFARVTSTDYVPALLQKGRERADAEGLQVTFRVADADALPFPDASFDVAISTFGVMFAPDPPRAAREMLRVVRDGGRIAMANWTPEGLVGQLFKIIGKHVPPPAGLKSPALWGTPDYLQQLFAVAPGQMQAQRKLFNFRYASAQHWIQVFRDYYGPAHKAFAALPPDGAQALEQDLASLLDRLNIAGPSSLVVPAEYLEVVIGKSGQAP